MARTADDDTVLELRQYTLRPGRRDELIELFDRELVEPQEAVGAHLLGQFRDPDRPDVFVWLRSFPDMESRRLALEAFYGGPVWAEHRDAANATMLDSDDVLLLRPVPGRPSLRTAHLTRPDRDVAPATVHATVLALDEPATPEVVDHVVETMRPALDPSGAELLGLYVTEPAANSFPALPVRDGENVLVWFGRDEPAEWAAGVEDDLAALGAAVAQRLRLSPTSRSLLR